MLLYTEVVLSAVIMLGALLRQPELTKGRGPAPVLVVYSNSNIIWF